MYPRAEARGKSPNFEHRVIAYLGAALSIIHALNSSRAYKRFLPYQRQWKSQAKNEVSKVKQSNCCLNFHREVFELDKEPGDYVVVHELLHFSISNHGKLWKSLVHAHSGDYKLEKPSFKDKNTSWNN